MVVAGREPNAFVDADVVTPVVVAGFIADNEKLDVVFCALPNENKGAAVVVDATVFGVDKALVGFPNKNEDGVETLVVAAALLK